MKFYVASFIGERERTREVQGRLRSLGHTIPVDWTAYPGVPDAERNERAQDTAAIAVRDLDGVRRADVFILLAGVPDGRAKYAELGAALACAVQSDRPLIYVIGETPTHSVFFFHPKVNRMRSLDDALQHLERIGSED